MPARRCTICNVDWPSRSEFIKCPACEEPTWMLYDQDSISAKETDEKIAEIKARAARQAEHAAAYKEFERRYEEREVERLRRELDEYSAQATW
jgi:hypothetical protein